MDTLDQVITVIHSIHSVDDEEQLELLEQVTQELLQMSPAEQGIDALFGIFERFPYSDGNGVFWSILHGIEKMPNYQPRLLRSVQTQPTEFNLRMVDRLMNSGTMRIGNVELDTFLDDVIRNTQHPDEARQRAKEIQTRHRESRTSE